MNAPLTILFCLLGMAGLLMIIRPKWARGRRQTRLTGCFLVLMTVSYLAGGIPHWLHLSHAQVMAGDTAALAVALANVAVVIVWIRRQGRAALSADQRLNSR